MPTKPNRENQPAPVASALVSQLAAWEAIR
jgi:hypothetical protein